MTLLPIIYTSLLIFSAVMTVILIISYISYKAKQRNTLPDNSIHEETVTHTAVMQIARPQYIPPVQPVPVTVYPTPARTSYSEVRRNSNSQINTTRHEQRRETVDYSSKKRFQVMNNSSRNEFLPNLQPASLGGFSRTPVSELNYLNYYSDKKEETLNSISLERYKSYR